MANHRSEKADHSGQAETSMIFEAIEFAVKAHAGQFRKGSGLPYVFHPLGAAKILIECGCSQEIVVAAILHDTIEDTSVTYEDIRSAFGEEIAGLVREVSAPDMGDSWENRKRHTIEHLKDAPGNVLLLACADKLDNITSIRKDYARLGEAVWDRFNRPRDRQKWYYESLADVFLNRREEEPGASLFERFAAEVKTVFGRDAAPGE